MDFHMSNGKRFRYSSQCAEYPAPPLAGKSHNNNPFNITITSVINARIGWVDFLLLMTMWLLIFGSSIKSFGSVPAIIFLALNTILVFRRASNGILVFLLLLFSPAISLDIPNFIYLSVAIAVVGYINDDPSLKRSLRLFNKMFLAAFSYVSITAFSLLIAPDSDLAVSYFIMNVEGLIALAVLFVLIEDQEDLGRMLKWWTILAGISLIICATHSILGTDTALFSIQDNIMENIETKINVFMDDTYVKRLLWPGKGPNYWSAYLIFPLAVSLAFWDAVSTFAGKVFWLLISGMIAIGIIGTFSRSGFLSVCIVLSLFLINRNVRAILPVLVILGFFAILNVANPQITDRIFGIRESLLSGAHHRFDQYVKSIEMWQQSPVWGNGTGAYIAVHTDEGLHNTFLQVAVESGLIGIVSFILVLWLSVKDFFSFEYSCRKRGGWGRHNFVLTLLFGLAGMLTMISTIPFREMKVLWLECGVCMLLHSFTEKHFGMNLRKH